MRENPLARTMGKVSTTHGGIRQVEARGGDSSQVPSRHLFVASNNTYLKNPQGKHPVRKPPLPPKLPTEQRPPIGLPPVESTRPVPDPTSVVIDPPPIPVPVTRRPKLPTEGRPPIAPQPKVASTPPVPDPRPIIIDPLNYPDPAQAEIMTDWGARINTLQTELCIVQRTSTDLICQNIFDVTSPLIATWASRMDSGVPAETETAGDCAYYLQQVLRNVTPKKQGDPNWVLVTLGNLLVTGQPDKRPVLVKLGELETEVAKRTAATRATREWTTVLKDVSTQFESPVATNPNDLGTIVKIIRPAVEFLISTLSDDPGSLEVFRSHGRLFQTIGLSDSLDTVRYRSGREDAYALLAQIHKLGSPTDPDPAKAKQEALKQWGAIVGRTPQPES